MSWNASRWLRHIPRWVVKPDVRTEQTRNSGKAHPGETLRKKIFKSATQNTPNPHLSYRDHPTPDPAAAGAETRVCLPKRRPYLRRLGAHAAPATYPLPESRGRFCRRSGRRAGSPSYSRKPTFAHSCGNRVSSQCMDAALQQLMSMGAIRRKSPSGMDVPTLFGRQLMQTSTKPA